MNSNRENKSVFSNRNFCLTFFGALVSELGALMYSFAVGFYILEISRNDAFLQGLYLAVCGLSLLLLTPLGGVLGDRFNKAKIMVVCDFLKGGSILLATSLLLVLRAPRAQIIILFLLGILGNAVSGVFEPAAGALLPHIVPKEKLQQANAYFSMKSALVGIVGIVLAGILYAALQIYTLFFVVGLCFVASAVSEMFIRCEHRPSSERLTLRLAFRDIGDGIRYLRGQKAILAMLGAILFINFFFAPVTGNFVPFFVKDILANAPSYLFMQALTPELWSSVFSVCFGLSSLLGAAILSARPQEEKCGHKTAVRLCLVAVAMIALTACYWICVDRGVSINAFLIVFSFGALVLGALISFINIPVNTLLMRIVDRDKLSKVNSILSIGSQGMIPLASVLAGAVLNTLGSTWLMTLCSLGFAVTALAMLLNRRIREI